MADFDKLDELNSSTILNNEDAIRNGYEKARKPFKVAIVLGIIVILVGISNAIITRNDFVFLIEGFVGLFISGICLVAANEHYAYQAVQEFKNNDSRHNTLTKTLLATSIPPIALLLIYGAYGTGRMFWIVIPCIISFVYLKKLTHYYKQIHFTIKDDDIDDYSDEYDEKTIADRYVIKEVKNHLTIVGKIFFVKYYYQLKNWATTDIEDIIEENYSEKSLKQRIESGKLIFERKLNIIALNIISKDCYTDEKTQKKL